MLGSPYEALQQLISFIVSLPEILVKKEVDISTSALLWVLGTFKDLQDALLAISPMRAFALAAFERQYLEVCRDALHKPR